MLGQIDGGPREAQIVSELYSENHTVCGSFDRPPVEYWAHWREECALADRIVVNSSWSQSLIEGEGVAASKIRVVPLAYERPLEAAGFQREYPEIFTSARPLRVLFLGSVCLRKGVRPLFDAIRILRQEPVEFLFVGALDVPIPADLRDIGNVHWFGRVSRSETLRIFIAIPTCLCFQHSRTVSV